MKIDALVKLKENNDKRLLSEGNQRSYWIVMSKCEECGRDLALPFICAYCGGHYCDEHRLPESHECSNQPTVAPPFARPQTPSKSKTNVSPHNYAEPTERPENMEKPRTRRHFPVGKVIGAILAIMIVGFILGGFGYAYINKLNKFNQTKSHLESLGFDISNSVSGMDISTFIKSASVVPMVDVASFISIARQYNSTTIYEEGFSFYVVTILIILITAYEYTPSNSIWWIWG